MTKIFIFFKVYRKKFAFWLEKIFARGFL